MKSPCQRIHDEFPAYERGESTVEARAVVREHLEQCGACREDARLDALILAELDALPTIVASPAFAPRVVALARSEAGLVPKVKRFRPVWFAAAAAAALVGAVGLWTWLGRPAYRDRDVIAELETLEQIELLGSDLALGPSSEALELLTRDGWLPPSLAAAVDEGGL